MNKTTYDLSPEEKMFIFNSRYRNLNSQPAQEFVDPYPSLESGLQEQTIDPLIIDKKPTQEQPKEKPKESKKKETKVNDFVYGFSDKVLGGIMPEFYFRAGKNEPGYWNDRPDPSSVSNSVFRRAKGQISNNITKEIDELDLEPEDRRYLKLLQFLEGGSNYKIVNSLGYKGLYQFHPDTLRTIKVNEEDYMSNSVNQHIAALKLKDFNLQKAGLSKYVGQTVGGIKLTENGLAAGAHLGGAGNVKKFIVSNGKKIAVDRNNLPITAYLLLFQ